MAKRSRLSKIPVMESAQQMGSMQDIGKKYVVKMPTVKRRMKRSLETAAVRSTGLNVIHYYAPKSKVMRSIRGMTAVKLSDGTKGWLTGTGFVSEWDVKMMMRSLDHTTAGWGSPVSLEETWDQATPQQRARMAKIMNEVDWDEFWKEYYPKDGREDYDTQADMYDSIVDKLTRVL